MIDRYELRIKNRSDSDLRSCEATYKQFAKKAQKKFRVDVLPGSTLIVHSLNIIRTFSFHKVRRSEIKMFVA